MEGITILNSYNHGNDIAFMVSIAILILMGLIVLISFICGCIYGFSDYHVSIWMTCGAIALFFGILAISTYENPTYYEVLIEDEVSMTEFTQRYEIVKQEGQIFTIKAKGG
jgi:low affinity Fe/Cu permease